MNQIQQFQSKNGLVADGIIGKKTLVKLKEVLQINSNESLAHFLGQVAHETGNFLLAEENLRYSAEGLLKTFPKYFKTLEKASQYAKNANAIGNYVYANRMGNGNEASSDGFIFRGRGALQLTGRDNYQKFSDYVGEDCIKNPELVSDKYFFESAKFFFDNNKLWDLAKKVDEASTMRLSKAINLGNINSKLVPNGLEDRIYKTKLFYTLLLSSSHL